jgi:hypothetical protein
MDVSVACWRDGESAFDRSGRARREMAAKLRRDVTANVKKVASVNFDPLGDSTLQGAWRRLIVIVRATVSRSRHN